MKLGFALPIVVVNRPGRDATHEQIPSGDAFEPSGFLENCCNPKDTRE